MPKIREGFFPGAGLIILNTACLPREDNKMEIGTIAQLVSSLGFPIVVAGAMFWKMNKQDDDHKEEMGKITEAVNNNTIALTKLLDKLNN